MSGINERPRIQIEPPLFSRDRLPVPESLRDYSHALLAPGQGSQLPRMGKELASVCPPTAARWNQADRAMQSLFGKKLTDIAWSETVTKEDLQSSEIGQPLIITDALGRCDALYESGQYNNPGWFSGYSAGFPVGLIAAGCLDIPGAIQLWKGRTKAFNDAIENSPRTSMVAFVDVPPDLEEEALRQFKLKMCIQNTQTINIFGGQIECLDKAKNFLQKNGMTDDNIYDIPVDAAYHSEFMARAIPEYMKAVMATPIEAPKNGKVICASTVKPLTTPDEIREALILQVIQTERYGDMIRFLRREGVATMTELNVVATLTNMHRELLGGKRKRISYKGNGESPVTIAQQWQAAV